MRKAIVLLGAMALGLSLQVKANERDDHYITIDGMEFCCFKDVGDTNYAQLTSGKNAKGDIVIPDSVKLNGESYVVWYIIESAFRNNDKITSVNISNSVIGIDQYAFMDCSNLRTVIIPPDTYCGESCLFSGCNLDTVIVSQSVGDVELSGAYIKDLFIQTGDTIVLHTNAYKIDNCHLGDINHLILDCGPFGNYWYFRTGGESYYEVKAVSVEAVEPPSVEKQGYSEPEDMKLCWTLLLVPDGSEEKYREAEFWKDFYCILPASQIDRFDEYVDKAYADFTEWVKERMAGVESLTQDVNECVIEGNQLQFTSVAHAEVCDVAGRVIHSGKHAQGESLTLPQGVSIVTVNGHCFKVAVK